MGRAKTVWDGKGCGGMGWPSICWEGTRLRVQGDLCHHTPPCPPVHPHHAPPLTIPPNPMPPAPTMLHPYLSHPIPCLPNWELTPKISPARPARPVPSRGLPSSAPSPLRCGCVASACLQPLWKARESTGFKESEHHSSSSRAQAVRAEQLRGRPIVLRAGRMGSNPTRLTRPKNGAALASSGFQFLAPSRCSQP